MMAGSKSPRARLLHIRDEIDGVAMIVRDLSFEQYQRSYMHRRAVERAVQIVSEAAKALPSDYLARYPDAPWTSIVGIGNIFGSMIQAVARQPELRGELQGIQWLGFALTEAVVFYGLIGGLLAYVLV